MNTETCQCQQLYLQECSQGGHLYIINLTVLLLIMTMIVITTVFWIRYTKQNRAGTRYSSNHLYQQASGENTTEDNLLINGYIIRMSRDQHLNEVPIERI